MFSLFAGATTTADAEEADPAARIEFTFPLLAFSTVGMRTAFGACAPLIVETGFSLLAASASAFSCATSSVSSAVRVSISACTGSHSANCFCSSRSAILVFSSPSFFRVVVADGMASNLSCILSITTWMSEHCWNSLAFTATSSSFFCVAISTNRSCLVILRSGSGLRLSAAVIAATRSCKVPQLTKSFSASARAKSSSVARRAAASSS